MQHLRYTRFFDSLTLDDSSEYGNKATSLAYLYSAYKHICKVPCGFAVSSDAYRYFIEYNNLKKNISDLLNAADLNDNGVINEISKKLKNIFMQAVVPHSIIDELTYGYKILSSHYDSESCDVAVRSSATLEDLPNASFAGQQESFLNIAGIENLIHAYKNCLASLFTSRAISYRMHGEFSLNDISMAVIIQKMVRSDLASSGVMFTQDPETGFEDVVVIASAYGLGESIVQGTIVPDECAVIKSKLMQGFLPIVKKKIGSKAHKIIYSNNECQSSTIREVDTTEKERSFFSINDKHILELARIGCAIEEDFSKRYMQKMSVDIEWAIDGKTDEVFIVQARPLAKKLCNDSEKNIRNDFVYSLISSEELKPLLSGIRVGNDIVHGTCFVANVVEDALNMPKNSILVVPYTSPDWVPVMRKAAGIITERGGRTCHAAIVARELGVPAIIGSDTCMSIMRTGLKVTLDCSSGAQGTIYEGCVPFTRTTKKTITDEKFTLPCKVLAILADPDKAWEVAQLPVDGVGLVRLEFLMAHVIGLHPNVVLQPDTLPEEIKQKLYKHIEPYTCPEDFFISELSRGIACIATAFGERKVLIRTSDFKSNEYSQLLGGFLYEKSEENPMLGLRGASRYLHDDFYQSFLLECRALRAARDVYGAHNIDIMIPFVRSPQELAQLRAILEQEELIGELYQTKLFMMVEVPTNIILLEEYAKYADGFSIGSNDLTQLILGIDRDSSAFAMKFNETDPAVVACIVTAIKKARLLGKPIGICGQAPADFPELATILIENGITSIALQASSVNNFFNIISSKIIPIQEINTQKSI